GAIDRASGSSPPESATRSGCRARPDTATALTRAPSRPARRLRPDPVSLPRRCASAWRSSAPPDGGTDDQPIDVCGLTIVMTYSPGLDRDRLDLPDFDPPVVFQVRAAFRRFDGFVVVGRVDDEITAHYLFGFGVWAVHRARLAVTHRDVAAPFVFELIASDIF